MITLPNLAKMPNECHNYIDINTHNELLFYPNKICHLRSYRTRYDYFSVPCLLYYATPR